MSAEKITEKRIDGTVVVQASGRVEMRGELRERMLAAVASAASMDEPVILDCSEWEYCDTGYSAVLAPWKAAHNSGVAFAVVVPRDRRQRDKWEGTFRPDDNSLKEVFYPTLQAALAALAMLRRNSRWHIGAVVGGLYEVIDVVGEGGMSVVHRVRHKGWNKELAVKSPRAELAANSAGFDTFERECETWVNLGSHPHIVSCYYVRRLGRTARSYRFKNVPRIFAEYIDGGSLHDWIRSGRLYDGEAGAVLERILDLAIQIAWGLRFAHDKGLVHQDVKPANVMITTDGIAKVTDFGLARARALVALAGGADETVLLTTGGMTPAFCSPEQAAGLPLSRATDVWSWGLSVLAMFTRGATWAAGPAAPEALRAYIDEHEKHAPAAMPHALAQLLERCFARSTAARPSMRDIANELLGIYRDVTAHVYRRFEPTQLEASADGLNNRALSLLDLNKPQEAQVSWEAALRADPHHLESIYNYGTLQWREGKITDDALAAQLAAASDRRRAATAERPRWRALHLRALVQLERGDIDGAVELLGRAAQLEPDAPEIHEALAATESPELVAAKCIRTFAENEPVRGVRCARLSADGLWALSDQRGGHDLVLWDVEQEAVERTFKGHTDTLRSVQLSHDMRLAVSGGDDATMRIWDVVTGSCKYVVDLGSAATLVALDRAGRFAVSSVRTSNGSILRLWDTNTGECLHTRNCDDAVMCAYLHWWHWNSDNWTVGAGCGDGTLREWDVKPGKWTIIGTHGRRSITDVCTADYGATRLTCGSDNTIRHWGRGSQRMERIFNGHTDTVRCISYNEDERWALSGSADGTLRLWNVANGRCLRTFSAGAAVDCVSLSSDGRRALSGGTNGMQVWQLSRGVPGPMQPSRV